MATASSKLVLGEVAHQAVAALLVVGVPAAGGGDEHGGDAEDRCLGRHGGRLADHQLGVGQEVVDVLDRPVSRSGARSAGSGASDDSSTRPCCCSVSTRSRFWPRGQALLLAVVHGLPGHEAHDDERLVGRRPERGQPIRVGPEAVRDGGRRARGSRRRCDGAPAPCPGSSPACTRCARAGRRTSWSAGRTRCRRRRPPGPAGRLPATAMDGPMIPVMTSGRNRFITLATAPVRWTSR